MLDVDLILAGSTYPSCFQLYGYGFAKIVDKSNIYFGAYVHPDFHRDHPTRACTIERRRTLVGRDRRFKNTNTAVGVHRIRLCGTKAHVYHRDSLSSLETWPSTGDLTSEVVLDSDWKTDRPRTSSVVDHTSDALLPSHVNLDDDWPADLQMGFSSSSNHNAASSVNDMLNFAKFMFLFEPRPIECMIKKVSPFPTIDPH